MTEVCSRCVMDSSAGDLSLDSNGYCRFCTDFFRHQVQQMPTSLESSEVKLREIVAEIQKSTTNRKYDCIVGLSGGVDSAWTLVQAVKLGLRPLAVHMDNGWNSDLAQSNIETLIKALGIDLFTYVIEWTEYRQLMQALFDADVIDVEMLYDHAVGAVLYRQAAKHGVRFICAGTNLATEGIAVPATWNWFKYDRRQIRWMARRVGLSRLRSFPLMGTLNYLYYQRIRRIRWISMLDIVGYDKEQATRELVHDYGFRPYPYKHYESMFTRLYQGYLLPKKFGVDKRRLHFSSLIVSGQMTRAQALSDLKLSPYSSLAEEQRDVEYFLKKMNWSQTDLANYLSRPGHPHSSYPTESRLWARSMESMQLAYRIKSRLL